MKLPQWFLLVSLLAMTTFPSQLSAKCYVYVNANTCDRYLSILQYVTAIDEIMPVYLITHKSAERYVRALFSEHFDLTLPDTCLTMC